MINTSEPVHLFTFNKDDDEDPSPKWTILMLPGTYIGLWYNFAVCIGVYCFKKFWFKPATPRHWPYSPGSSQHAIVDDNVEAAPIYKSVGMGEEPRRPHKNLVLCIEQETARLESHCKVPALSEVSSYNWIIGP